MKNKKLLWIGILIGFFASVLLFGAAVLAWKLFDRRAAGTEEANVNPVITPVVTAPPEPTPVELETSLWEGTWERTGDTQFDGSVITITDPKDGTISFHISAYSGGSTGELSGTATIEGKTALFIEEKTNYTIHFSADGEALTVTLEGDATGVLGDGVLIDCSYRKGSQERLTQSLTELGVFDSREQEQTFREYMKADYQLFADTFQQCSSTEDLDGYQAKVTTGVIRGTASEQGAIVMAGPDLCFWAAVLDHDVVKYYTNSADKYTLPITIDWWRQDFQDKKVVLAGISEELQA